MQTYLSKRALQYSIRKLQTSCSYFNLSEIQRIIAKSILLQSLKRVILMKELLELWQFFSVFIYLILSLQNRSFEGVNRHIPWYRSSGMASARLSVRIVGDNFRTVCQRCSVFRKSFVLPGSVPVPHLVRLTDQSRYPRRRRHWDHVLHTAEMGDATYCPGKEFLLPLV